MSSKNVINKFFKIGIKSWLKFICKSIDIHSLKLNINKKCFGKVDKFTQTLKVYFTKPYINKLNKKIFFLVRLKENLIYLEDINNIK